MRNPGDCLCRRRGGHCCRGGKNAAVGKRCGDILSRRETHYNLRLQSMSSHIRAGVVGVGSIGKNHARIYSELPEVEFSAILDTNRETATAVSTQYGISAVTDLSEFAELVDVATVATPTPDHYETGKFLLNRGKHLLIEKPITETPEQAQELVTRAKEGSLS